jgi:hypothetical protein
MQLPKQELLFSNLIAALQSQATIAISQFHTDPAMRYPTMSPETKESHGPPPVQIHVNEQPVVMADHKATGLEIKQAAVAQGVRIQVDFVLSEELANGRVKIVGDNDTVTLNKNSRFDAVPNDDQA